MNFSKPIITKSGKYMSNQSLFGEGNIKIDAVYLGQGCDSDNPEELTSIVNPVMEAQIIGFNVDGNNIVLEFTFDNTKLKEDFTWREYGIMATYTASDGTEIKGLYCYGFDSSENPEHIAHFTDSNSYYKGNFKIGVSIGNAENVNVNLKEYTDFVPQEEFEKKCQELEGKIALLQFFSEFFVETVDGGVIDD